MVTKRRINNIVKRKSRKQYGGSQNTTIYVKMPINQMDYLDLGYMIGDNALDNYLSKEPKDGFIQMQVDLSFIDDETKTAAHLFGDFYKAYKQVCFGTEGKDVKTALSANVSIKTIKKLFKSLSAPEKDITDPVEKFITMIENIKLIKKHKLTTNNLKQKLSQDNNPGFLKKAFGAFKSDKSIDEIKQFIQGIDFTFSKHTTLNKLENVYGNAVFSFRGNGPHQRGMNPYSGFYPGQGYGLTDPGNQPTHHLEFLRHAQKHSQMTATHPTKHATAPPKPATAPAKPATAPVKPAKSANKSTEPKKDSMENEKTKESVNPERKPNVPNKESNNKKNKPSEPVKPKPENNPKTENTTAGPKLENNNPTDPEKKNNTTRQETGQPNPPEQKPDTKAEHPEPETKAEADETSVIAPAAEPVAEPAPVDNQPSPAAEPVTEEPKPEPEPEPAEAATEQVDEPVPEEQSGGSRRKRKVSKKRSTKSLRRVKTRKAKRT